MSIDLNIPQFRINFPMFSDETAYPDSLLEFQYELGKCFIADNDCTLPEQCREYALQLMLAHLLYLRDQSTTGSGGGKIASASEGDVSVSFSLPTSGSDFKYWFNLSPYGMEILAMLSSQSVGGFYVGGLPERSGFRKIGGVF